MTATWPVSGHQAPVAEVRALKTEQAGPDQAAAELLTLGKDCAARLKDPWRTADHGALLFDDKRLPR